MQERTKLRFAFALLSCIALGIFFSSCTLPGVTIAARVQDFNNGVSSGSYGSLYMNFSSTGTQDYSQMQAASFWNTTPFAAADSPGAITITDSSNASNVTGTFTSGNGPYTVTLDMVQSGQDYYIQTMSWTGASDFSITAMGRVR